MIKISVTNKDRIFMCFPLCRIMQERITIRNGIAIDSFRALCWVENKINKTGMIKEREDRIINSLFFVMISV